MPKEIPDCPTKPNPVAEAGRRFEIELITPMVGGGADPGIIDPRFPIRPTAIRGHLRHWWRLIRGYSLGTKMWRREEEIFGSTEFPSPLRVQAEASPIGEWVEPSAIGDPSLKYLLFPSIENKQRLAQEGLSFRVDLAWENEGRLDKRRVAQNARREREKKALLPDRITSLDQDIDLATRAWLIFGGIGARTRRGCGALSVKNTPPSWNVADVQSWLQQFLQPDSRIEKILCLHQPMSYLDAWKRVAETWKTFRQPGPAKLGEPRRRFPEAETIRRATGRRSRRARFVPESEVPSGFPRAELGLPIIFQFKDTTDPKPTTVNRSGSDADGRPIQRMASPFILKPLAVGKDRAVPMIVLLKAPRVSSVRVSPTPLGDQEFPVLGSPIVGSPAGSAIEAFLKFADAQGYTEVTR
ncbi:MAG: type III-B CRISPR module RAMP protein Cmr1 [Isosphaerales bacterium]